MKLSKQDFDNLRGLPQDVRSSILNILRNVQSEVHRKKIKESDEFNTLWNVAYRESADSIIKKLSDVLNLNNVVVDDKQNG